MTKIHPTAVIAKGATLAENVEVGPYCVLGSKVKLGKRVRLESHVVIDGDTELGEGCLVYPFASLGTVPQDLKYQGEDTKLVIGKNNRFGQTVTAELGTGDGGGVTRIGDNGLYMIGCHIGHDSHLGDGVIMANHVTLAGHVQIGDCAFIGGMSSVHQFCRMGEHAMLAGASGLKDDVIPYATSWGTPAVLAGLNLVGLRRRGFDGKVLRNLRQAYDEIFSDKGTLKERVQDVEQRWQQSAEVMRVIEFIHGTVKQRRLCLPGSLPIQ